MAQAKLCRLSATVQRPGSLVRQMANFGELHSQERWASAYPHEIIMLCCHIDLLLDIFWLNTRFVNLLQSILNYYKTLQWDYSVNFLQAQTKTIPRKIIVSQFIQNVSLGTCISYTSIAKPLPETSNLQQFVRQQKKLTKRRAWPRCHLSACFQHICVWFQGSTGTV